MDIIKEMKVTITNDGNTYNMELLDAIKCHKFGMVKMILKGNLKMGYDYSKEFRNIRMRW